MAKKNDLKIIEIFKESKSARKPDNRPYFKEMIDRIENGEADSILCWQINRLSRNPIESGMANQYILELSKNVKRGMRSKITKGWYPQLAPIGYINDKVKHEIKIRSQLPVESISGNIVNPCN